MNVKDYRDNITLLVLDYVSGLVEQQEGGAFVDALGQAKVIEELTSWIENTGRPGLVELENVKDELEKEQQKNTKLKHEFDTEKEKRLLGEDHYKNEIKQLQESVKESREKIAEYHEKEQTQEIQNLADGKEKIIADLRRDLKDSRQESDKFQNKIFSLEEDLRAIKNKRKNSI
eukprot:UN02120